MESAGISIIGSNQKRKISYTHGILPNVPLTSCIKEEKKDLPIIDPPSMEDTNIHNNTVLIESTENNVVENGVMEVEDNNI